MLERLKERVYRETLKLREYGLAVPTGGSVSGIDREKGLVVIRPGGVSCGELTSAEMLVVDLIDGRVAEGKHRPPIDTPTHLYLYRAFPGIGGLVHTRSVNAAAWAQAGKDLPVYGATQADAFCGAVPCTRALTEKEVKGTYELNVGKVIEETFEGKDAALIPAALVRGHGPFVWGETPERAVENAAVLELSAETAIKTLLLEPNAPPAENYLTEKRYARRHGKKVRGGRKK